MREYGANNDSFRFGGKGQTSLPEKLQGVSNGNPGDSGALGKIGLNESLLRPELPVPDQFG